MKPPIDQDRVTLEMLFAAIAHSQIVVEGSAKRLPDGFDNVDAAILDWIAAEGHRLGRGFVGCNRGVTPYADILSGA